VVHRRGALVAWRGAPALASSTARPPMFFVPSALPPSPGGSGRTLDPTKVLQAIVGSRPQSTLASFDAFRADFVADLALWENVPVLPSQPLSVPIAGFMGVDDPFVAPADMLKWREQTTGAFSLETLAGDHFYLYKPAPGRVLLRRLALLFAESAFPPEKRNDLQDEGAALAREAAIP
jgi:surfactin synthase thioesterase subunit